MSDKRNSSEKASLVYRVQISGARLIRQTVCGQAALYLQCQSVEKLKSLGV